MGAELDVVPRQNVHLDHRSGKRGADAQQRLRDTLRCQGIHFGMRGADQHEPRARALGDRPGGAGLGGVVAGPLGPLGGLQIFGLQRHEGWAVDLGENLAGVDPVAANGENPLDAAWGPGREMGQAAGIELKLARRSDAPMEGVPRRYRGLDAGDRDGGGCQEKRRFRFGSMQGFRFAVVRSGGSFFAAARNKNDENGPKDAKDGS